MAKTKLSEYDSVSINNLDIDSISLAEGVMIPSDVNNALRELMAHLKDFADGTEAVNAISVDNLKMDGNTISSTDANGNIVIAPNGTGEVDISKVDIDGGAIDGTPIGATSPSTGAFTTLSTTGLTTTGDINFGDNDKAQFGAGNDLQIYHDGSNSYIADEGTGNLRVSASDRIQFYNAARNEFYAQFIADGKTALYYDSNEKLATTSTGVDVTGTVTMDGLTVEDATPEITVSSTTLANLATIKFTSGGADVDSKITHQANTGVMTIDSGRNASWGGKIDFVTDTVKRANISNNGDISFYDSTGVSQGFFWDSSTQRLGLGSTTPIQKLDIYGGNIAVSSADIYQTAVNIDNTDTGGRHFGLQSTGSINTAGRFRIYDYDANVERMTITSGGSVGIGTASPSSKVHINTGSYGEALRFQASSETGGYYTVGLATGAGLAFSRDGSEAMRIDSSRNLLVSKTASNLADVGHEFLAGGDAYHTKNNGVVMRLNRLTSDGTIVDIRRSGTTVGSIKSQNGTDISIGSANTELRFFDSGDQIFPTTDNLTTLGRFDSRFKDLYLSGGAYLGGTGSANYLDDYEEGTFVPILSFGGGTTGITYSSQVGIYTKVGRKVTATIEIVLTSKGTSTGSAGISMPFTSASIGFEQGHHQPYLPNVTVDGRATHYIGNGTTSSLLVDQNDSGSATFMDNTNFANNSIIRSTITYFTA